MSRKKEANSTAKQKSGLAIASLVLGIVSFIPGLSFITGIIAIVFGAIALKTIKARHLGGKRMAIWGIVLGGSGILFTIIIYSSLFFMLFAAKSGPFTEVRVVATKQLLTQNAGALELYKKNHGQYPVRLEDVNKEKNNSYILPVDQFMQNLIYKVASDRQSYELRSVGPDGEYGTKDDIVIH